MAVCPPGWQHLLRSRRRPHAPPPRTIIPHRLTPAPTGHYPCRRRAELNPNPRRDADGLRQSRAGRGGGGYVVQVSSQRNEADAQASYRALQGKYPSVLGSQSLLVKRVDLGEKGVYYRAFAGPFSSADQATQVCNNLKAAGGPQCLIQRN